MRPCSTGCWTTRAAADWASVSADYRRQMAELFAPFSKVAAKNPFSSSPVERSVDEIMTVTDDNRMICDPYPRLIVARDQVNQGAAALLMSVDAARRLGVAEEKWVYLRGHADKTEQDLLDRVDVGVSFSAMLAVQEALRVSGIGIDDVATFDLYSCFPFPVFVVCDEFGLANDDPRGFTLTGGLPYFGGPGNSYSLHGIAETVAEMRDKPGSFGLVGANGGVMSKYSVGIYSTDAADWEADRSEVLQQDIAALPKVPVTKTPMARRPSRRTRCAMTGLSRPGSSSAGSTPTTAGSWPSPKTTIWWR